MQEVGWQEGVIQSVSNFMFQNRHQVRKNASTVLYCTVRVFNTLPAFVSCNTRRQAYSR